MIPPGFEPGTSRVLGERDNHYTTESAGAANEKREKETGGLLLSIFAILINVANCNIFVAKLFSTLLVNFFLL